MQLFQRLLLLLEIMEHSESAMRRPMVAGARHVTVRGPAYLCPVLSEDSKSTRYCVCCEGFIETEMRFKVREESVAPMLIPYARRKASLLSAAGSWRYIARLNLSLITSISTWHPIIYRCKRRSSSYFGLSCINPLADLVAFLQREANSNASTG